MPRRPYGMVEMPQPPQADLFRSLSAIMQMSGASEQRRRQAGDQQALDQAYAPVPSRPTGPAGGGYETASGEIAPGPSQPTAPRAPTRDEVIGRVPAHLRTTVQKHFDDADERALRIRKLKDDIATADADYLGGLGVSVKSFDYDPASAITAIAHAKDTYRDDPQRLSTLEQMEQQIGEVGDPSDPTQAAAARARVQKIVDAVIMNSPEQRKLEASRVKPPTSDYARSLERYAVELGHTPTKAEELDFRKDFEAAGRAEPSLGSIDDQINAADKAGNAAEKARLLRVKAQSGAAGRDPDGVATRREATIAQKAVAERWKQDALATLEEGLADGTFSQADLPAAKARIQASYLEQINATTSKSPTPARSGTVPAGVQTFFKDKGAGVVTLRDGKKWRKAADGTITPVR